MEQLKTSRNPKKWEILKNIKNNMSQQEWQTHLKDIEILKNLINIYGDFEKSSDSKYFKNLKSV